MKQLKHCWLLGMLISFCTVATAQKAGGGYINASFGLGYRIAKTDESVNAIPGLKDIVDQQRSGTILHLDGGFFLEGEKRHSLGAVFNRFSTTATGTISIQGLGSTSITSKDAITYIGLLYGNHIYFSGKDKSCAVLKAGLGYNNYNSEAINVLGNSEKISQGGLGYMVGADLDIKLVKGLFFSAGLNLISGSVKIETDGENSRENLSMFTGTGGLKFRF
jgi:hypothetical protein